MRAVSGWIGRHATVVVGWLVLAYMSVPVLVVMGLAVNKPQVSEQTGRETTVFHWNGFTLDNITGICSPDGLCDSLKMSVGVSLTATVLATLIGTLMAFALVRHTFRGRSAANLLIFLPMATPEVVMGSSLLAMFVSLGLDGVLGFATIVIAHVMFCLSFVVVTVKARLTGMDDNLEQAAMDLYANEWTTFRLVTLPLAMPGIVAAALLSFSLSFDDFIVTNFTAGKTETFPVFVWNANVKGGLPPQLFVVGGGVFCLSILLVIIGSALGWRREARAH